MSNNNLKNEILFLIRNNDVFPVVTRGVTTTTATGTFAGDSSVLINRTNVKNIRSIVVGAVTLTYGEDYTIDLDYDDSGTLKCKITFTAAQTGDYTITYDYGNDKIFGDFPRDDLKINSYPRIAVDQISKGSDVFGVGGSQFISSTMLTIVIYSQSYDFIEEKLATVEALIRTNAKNLYYAPFMKPTGQGPLIKSEDRSQTILHKNQDIMAMFAVDSV